MGANEWEIVDAGDGVRFALFATLPSGEFVTLPLYIDRGRGGAFGDGYYWWSWDGNRERPSIRNSIQGETWHGFLDDGEFVLEVEDEGGEWWK